MAGRTNKRDPRPKVWVGHVELETRRLDDSEKFMRDIGMRTIVKAEDFAVLELRGGTHLVLIANKKVRPGEASFDLMVDDLEAAHQKYQEMGLSPSAVKTGHIHRWFYLKEPSGHRIQINSSHVSSRAV